MSRTDDLRNRGATDRTGGGGAFVRWPKDDRHVWIEGEVRELWESEYGPAVSLRVSAVDGVVAGGGEGSPARDIIPGEEVNVGLNYASLKDAVRPEDVGTKLHFAFEGWGETKSGDNFRRFAVLEVPSPAPAGGGGAPVSEPDDSLPF